MSASTTGGKRAGVMQPFAPPLDMAFIGEFAQHAIERGAVGILGAEGARDLARADLAAALADEGEKLLARGQGVAFHGPLIGRVLGRVGGQDSRQGRRVGLFGSLCGLAWGFAGRRPFGGARGRPFAGRLDCAAPCPATGVWPCAAAHAGQGRLALGPGVDAGRPLLRA